MNTVTPASSAANEPPASPEQARVASTTTAPGASPTPRAGNGLVLLALALAVVALVLCGLMWQRLAFTQEELARRTRDAEAQVVEARTLAAQAEALTQELQARLGVAEVRLSEVSLQRSQLEELMLSLSRSRDDNLVQDLEATLRVALQQAQLTGSAQPLVSALQAAEQRIARAAQPRLNPVQRAIARDIDRIRGAALADIPALAAQLDELVRQVDAWPVANAVGVSTEASAPTRPDPVQPAQPAVPAEADGAAPGAWRQWAARWNAWWRSAIDHSLQQARDLVRVSRIDQPDAALLAPEQAFFLRENLKLQLLNARLALLARQLPASQADVQAVENKLRRYFDTRSPAVAGALTSLGRLRRDLVAQDLPRPDETLAALAAAAGGALMRTRQRGAMRSVFWLLGLAALAVALALLVGNNRATVTLFWPPWRFDVSFNFFVFALIGGFVLVYAALRALAVVRELPTQARRWRSQQLERAVVGWVLDALANQLAGRFVRAQGAAQNALDHLRGGSSRDWPRRAQLEALAHLLVAESAHALQNRAKRDEHLQATLTPATAKASPEVVEGALLRAVRWAVEDRDPAAARSRLAELPQGAARRIQALRLRLRVARLGDATAEALETARLLAKHRAFSPEAARSIVHGLALDALRGAHDLAQLQRVWDGLDAGERITPGVALLAAERAHELLPAEVGERDALQAANAARVRAWLEPLWDDFGALEPAQQARLARAFEPELMHLDAAGLARLEQLQRQWPQNAHLQYLAGQACLHRQLWGKAGQLLGQARHGLVDPMLKRRTWRALARLAEERGDSASALEAWKNAARLD